MLNHHIENLQQQIAEYKTSLESDCFKGGQKTRKGGQKRWSEKLIERIGGAKGGEWKVNE